MIRLRSSRRAEHIEEAIGDKVDGVHAQDDEGPKDEYMENPAIEIAVAGEPLLEENIGDHVLNPLRDRVPTNISSLGERHLLKAHHQRGHKENTSQSERDHEQGGAQRT